MPKGIYIRTKNLGLKPIYKICKFCKKEFTTNCLMPNKIYCNQSCRSQNNLPLNLLKLNKIDREYQKQIVSQRCGELHPNWKGGVSKGYKDGYYSKEYKFWRKSIFERDNYKCQNCNKSGIFITAHHIKSFAHYPELRFEIDNGLTLCEPCHSLTDNYKGRNKGKKILTLV